MANLWQPEREIALFLTVLITLFINDVLSEYGHFVKAVYPMSAILGEWTASPGKIFE